MTEKFGIIVLVYCLLRELFFFYQVNKLTNKLMSRNFYDYEITKTVGKEKKKEKIVLEDELSEDFGTLQGII